MTGSTDIDPGRFVESLTPLLRANDLEGLCCHLKRHYRSEQITSLLSCPDRDAQKVAAVALSLVGRQCCIPALAERLRDPDPLTNQMAEHALWSVWFRCGSQPANDEVARGARALCDRRFDDALEHFRRAIEMCPNFAEAYNQRAIAWYMLEEFDKSAADGRKAIELMPCHFGAWAGLGHCHAHRGRIEQAIWCYQKALDINPHLDCILEAVCELKKQSV